MFLRFFGILYIVQLILSFFQIDQCNRIWVLDTGIFGTDRLCPAKLLIFDLYTNRLVDTLEIPENVARNNYNGEGLLITPIVETYGTYCEYKTVRQR